MKARRWAWLLLPLALLAGCAQINAESTTESLLEENGFPNANVHAAPSAGLLIVTVSYDVAGGSSQDPKEAARLVWTNLDERIDFMVLRPRGEAKIAFPRLVLEDLFGQRPVLLDRHDAADIKHGYLLIGGWVIGGGALLLIAVLVIVIVSVRRGRRRRLANPYGGWPAQPGWAPPYGGWPQQTAPGWGPPPPPPPGSWGQPQPQPGWSQPQPGWGQPNPTWGQQPQQPPDPNDPWRAP